VLAHKTLELLFWGNKLKCTKEMGQNKEKPVQEKLSKRKPGLLGLRLSTKARFTAAAALHWRYKIVFTEVRSKKKSIGKNL